MSANKMQVGGNHYSNKAIQPWDYIVSNGLGYLDGCVVKYVTRYKEKGGVDDLSKAAHYLQKLIEIVQSQPAVIIEVAPPESTPVTRKRAPYGYKADGTPKKRPGRPRKV